VAIVGVDVGGTFTDLMLYDGRRIRAHKTLTDPADPSKGLREGLRELGVPAGTTLVHGSTIATNAFLERKGARVLLVLTRGFRDLAAIGRQTRGKLYDLFWRKPRPLVRPGDILTVRERIDAAGRVVTPIRAGGLRVPRGIESAAVCFLHSYRNPRHERVAGRRLSRAGVPVLLSSSVFPEYREFERLSTTLVNAYLAPTVRRYAERLRRDLRRHPLRLMGSQGGCSTLEGAIRRPGSMILSGPAAGVVAADELSRRIGDPRLITLDMGGTSADVSLLDHGPLMTREATLDNIPIRTPMLDTVTIGAGGGSVAWIDDAGALRVGPRSQGSTPGPACYGRGGDLPTVTDAHLILGRLDAGRFFGGRLKLDAARARSSIRILAQGLGRSAEEVAEAILRIANSNMERAIRQVSLERGYDARDWSLVAFGGAGPLHGAELAAGLELRRVIVPPHPGNFCALGAILADIVKERSRTLLLPCEPASQAAVARSIGRLERELISELRRERIRERRPELRPSLEMRYKGQSYELTVPWTGRLDRAGFERAHERRFGFRMAEKQVEVVNALVQLRVPVDKPPPVRARPVRGASSIPRTFRWEGRARPIRHWDRSSLPRALRGPALIHEPGATTFVPPGFAAELDRWGNLILESR
jgi:N-methylhydantoinase A